MIKSNLRIKVKEVFAIIVIIYIVYASSSSIEKGTQRFYKYFKEDKNLVSLIEDVNKIYDDMFSLNTDSFNNKGHYINFNGYISKAIGKKEMNDRILLKNGHLAPITILDETQIKKVGTNITNLNDYINSQGNQFLFVLAPNQLSNSNDIFPKNYISEDNTNESANNLLEILKINDVPYLDLRELIKKENINMSEYFFKTDHHWKPELGFWSFTKIMDYLNSKNFINDIDNSYLKLENYSVDIYENIFLGSDGKRTGKYFAGVDNISQIYPNFNTSIKVEIKSADLIMEGTFKDATFENNFMKEDYFNSNPYSLYGHGDRDHIKYKNLLSQKKENYMLIGDSFSNVTFPFFSLIVISQVNPTNNNAIKAS